MTKPVGHPSPSLELECLKCGTVAVNRDFCSCGEYLAWEATTLPSDGSEPSAYRPPAPTDTYEATLLTLRDPASLDEPGAAVSVSVMPGTGVGVLATVRNQSQIVDAFDVRVDGLPDTWWTVSPATVFLNPWGTSEEFEQEVQVQLHPPKASESQAREWPLTVVAHSRALDVDVARAPATLTIQPFHDTVMRAGPERRRGRRHAGFDVVVENRGNSPMEIAIAAEDTAARCPVTITPERTTVPVGGSVAAVVRVGVPFPLIFARPVDHRLTITHQANGADCEQEPSRVTFQQRPWLPWWLPPAVGVLAAFITLVLMLKRHPEAPNLTGRTVENATKLLNKHDLKVGRTTYESAPKGIAVGSVIAQVPEAGAEIVRGTVDITLAEAPKRGLVPSVTGGTLGAAAHALAAEHLGDSPQPPNAGDDWIVIRQDPARGSTPEVGTKVTLAVESPTPAATPTPTPTATPTPTPTPTPAASAAPPATKVKSDLAASAGAPKAKAKATANANPTAKAAALPPLPKTFVFAGATSGRLYRWASADAKAESLTAPAYRLQTPTKTDDGYVAVQILDAGRRLVWIAADGKTVDAIAEGGYYRPAYSPSRGLLAVIAADGQGDAPDAGNLCVMDPHDTGAPACAPALADGRRIGRPSWAPNGRSVLALAAGPDGDYNELLTFAPNGDDPAQWAAPTRIYRSAGFRSAVWVSNDRIAVLLAVRPGGPAHLRLLGRRPDGSFKQVKDFPALTGSELAATGHYLALQRGDSATGGAIDLLDADRAHPWLRRLTTGVNPAWAG
ncbi:PASTA domain-containing protein [Solirubrobacter ginsenosidimutans]|uniref:PASTA domain-containing protein n=1 Tax=Solirubrobacter ginsenosidimutans TaxID=490573 RepID=A0A9X3MP09_9ACTN|nr:PASTA domain-containing protein [Solirubrobacter ginsenosidimutans]MDA0159161.1 PASTA domain-containing protein [Solirubrobacter ginsenosidimutans]